MVLEAYYRCKCMSEEAELTVEIMKPNPSPTEWVECIYFALVLDHSDRCPDCVCEEMDYIKVPHFREILGSIYYGERTHH